MKNLQMVDLISQHAKIKSELDTAIQYTIENAAFIKGPKVASFENELCSYLGVNHVVGCANGTDALQLAFMALNLPKGSEVLVPDFTFIATAEVLALMDLIPVFVDVDKDTFNISIDAIKRSITGKTKAIVPVHMFGRPADMEAIMNIAKENNLYVVEDTAQATGAEYQFKNGTIKKCGTIGHIGTTSFFPSKNLSCMGDGGAVFTNDDDLAANIKCMANHGMDAQYEYIEIGVNSRLDGIQAAILSVKLKYLDDYNNARFQAAEKYSKALKRVSELICPKVPTTGKHIFHQYTLIVNDESRDELQKYLASKGIPTKIYYPIPFHEHEPYKKFPHNLNELENSIWLSNHVLSLPMHTELENDQIEFITNSIKEFYA